MKGISKTLIFTMICGVFFLIIGCEPENKTDDSKKERLFAAENMELKKEIENLKKTHTKELASAKAELAECQKQNDFLSEQVQEETTKVLENEITNMLMEESQRLNQENEELKALIEELKNQ